MTKQEVLEYVMNTPYNTNPAVLGSLLDGLIESEGSESLSLFNEAYHEKISALGGHDTEHEVGDDFWAEATTDGTVVDATTITDANYKMWTWMTNLLVSGGIILAFNLTGEQGSQITQMLLEDGDYHQAIIEAASLANVTLPEAEAEPGAETGTETQS